MYPSLILLQKRGELFEQNFSVLVNAKQSYRWKDEMYGYQDQPAEQNKTCSVAVWKLLEKGRTIAGALERLGNVLNTNSQYIKVYW